MNSPKRGTRDCYCSVGCWPPMSDEQKRKIAAIFDDGGRERRRAERRPHPADAPSPPGIARRHLPGQPRPSDTVLQAYREWYDAGVAANPMWTIWYHAPEDVFRWRAKFDCGCVEERLTDSDDPHSLLECRDSHLGTPLLPGEYRCDGDHPKPSLPLRDIASWDERLGRRHLPADPVDPQHGFDSEMWATIRHSEARWVANWKATLTCGHQIEVQRDADWNPDQGIRRATPQRLVEMRAELAEPYAPEPIPDRVAKVLDAGWPELATYMDCSLCPVVRRVVACEPLGWLVAPPKPPRQPRKEKSRQQILQERIRRTERELRHLRGELKELPPEDA